VGVVDKGNFGKVTVTFVLVSDGVRTGGMAMLCSEKRALEEALGIGMEDTCQLRRVGDFLLVNRMRG